MTTRKPKQSKQPIVLTDEQQRLQVINRWYDDFNRTQTVLQPKPTRIFQVGEQVGLGHLDNVIVQQVFEENMVYLVSYERTDREGTTSGLHDGVVVLRSSPVMEAIISELKSQDVY